MKGIHHSFLSKIDICNVIIDNLTMQEALSETARLIETGKDQYIVTPNVDHIIKLQKDEEFADIYRKANLVLADGMPLLWASKYLGTPLKERVTGSDLLPELCKLSAQRGYKVFLLGGRPGAAERAGKILSEKFKGLNIVGTYCPPFGFEHSQDENRKIIHIIKEVGPDIVFVGLGAPKQEKWIYSNKELYKAKISIGVGVSFEFIAGMVKRAPIWLQRIGMEWFWRLIMEPKRLWKRYLKDDMKIFKLVYFQKKHISRNFQDKGK